jgi:hypothetical protein
VTILTNDELSSSELGGKAEGEGADVILSTRRAGWKTNKNGKETSGF